MRNKIAAFVLAICMLNSAATAEVFQITSGSTDVSIATDAIEVKTIENAPVCKNGRTLSEAGDLKKIFGLEILDENGIITVSYGGKSTSLSVTEGNIDGEKLDVSAEYIEGKLFLPLRAVLEKLGMSVNYSVALNKVIVSNNPVVMEVAGNTLRLDEFDFYYDIQTKNFEAMGATTEQIEEMSAQIKSQVINSLKELNALYYAAEGSGFTSMFESSEAKAEIATYAEEFLKNSGIIALDGSVGIELEKSNIVNNYLQIVNMSLGVNDEEIAEIYNNQYITAKHILIPTINLETGEALEEKEVEAAEKLAKEIKTKIEKGEDFDKLMNEFSKDTGLVNYPDGYTFTKGEMIPEFETAAFALEENKVSEIVEGVYGYHIIKRLPLAKLSEETKTAITGVIKELKLNEYITGVVEKSNIQIYD